MQVRFLPRAHFKIFKKMIIDGKQIAKELELNLIEKLSKLRNKKILFVIFKNIPAIEQFVQMKIKVGTRLAIDCEVIKFTGETNNQNALNFLEEVLKKVESESCDGVVVQLPLPSELDTDLILNKIPVNLDIDVLGENAIAKYLNNETNFVPPVANAISEILKNINIDLNNKNILIIGHGRLVGQPVSYYFSKNKIPFDVITEEINKEEYEEKLKNADIIISGVGSPQFIKKEMIKSGVVIIDAGTSEQAGKLVGDAGPDCIDVASYITPVPGGVGPIVVVSLFNNLINN